MHHLSQKTIGVAEEGRVGRWKVRELDRGETILFRVVRRGSTDKVTFDLRPEGSKGENLQPCGGRA